MKLCTDLFIQDMFHRMDEDKAKILTTSNKEEALIASIDLDIINKQLNEISTPSTRHLG